MFDVLADEFWRAVVVVEDGEDAFGDGVVGYACAHVDAEEEVYQCVDQDMDLRK